MDKIITREGVFSNLKTKDISLSVYDCVDSTNSLLKQMAINGKAEGEVIIALSQTAGRGRYDRKFHSDKGGIYMSILLRPKTIPDTAILTAATAVAVSDAIEKVSNKKTYIKWVNDVLIDNKKVCGILCEGGFMGNEGFIIVGIGINASPPENGFNSDIEDIAGTVFADASSVICEQLAAEVIDNLFYQYDNLDNLKFLNTYRKKNLVLGKTVDILKQGKIIGSGKVLEIDDNCHLLVKLSNGETTTLSSGEVSVKM